MAATGPVADWERSIPRDRRWGGCRSCRHFGPDMTRAAFPARIPLAIASGEVDHLVVRPGHVGTIVYEPARRPGRAEPVPLAG